MPMRDVEILDRAKGCLVGLAVGDALGTTLEFTKRDSQPPVADMVGGGPFRLKPGQWTDDTSMALCLADSLLHRNSFNPTEMMDRFVDWMREGYNSSTGECFDIGDTTRAALRNYIDEGIAGDASASPSMAGNGSIMRLAPAVLFSLDDRDRAIDLSVRQSRPTHAAPEVLEACALMGAVLHAAITGNNPSLPVLREPKIRKIADGAYLAKVRDDIRSSGYVIDTLEAALWAVSQTDNFRDALLLAVNLGDDADTVGAVAGQLAGAKYGYNAIPQEWRNTLAWHDKIAELSVSLVRAGLNRSRQLTPQPPMA
ncbi:MAG: hypothetical protein DI551_05055 [Micavibrio aeruginosavorus]|uniref:ADP-ribosyl-[dinitrogen reductase] hydrolase n=1 Tax=Micavibrio aeruginosavorus TaxID=349221 RepID=A0A2W5N073_9BACT|nr:MAG: hypothetical protein DI551_05055 [Micavibrio aeruginosavorus]